MSRLLNTVSRRWFLTGVAGALAGWHARATRRNPRFSDDGFIVDSRLERCAQCDRLRGHVNERYNGKISVLCSCADPLGDEASMSSSRHDELVWTPLTQHVCPDGTLSRSGDYREMFLA